MVATENGNLLMDKQIASVDEFLSWWSLLPYEKTSGSEASTDRTVMAEPEPASVIAARIEAQIIDLALTEPVDVLIKDPAAHEPAEDLVNAIQVTQLDYLIGSSPTVFTIKETYLPYDLSKSDLHLWNTYSTASHPFCVRDQMRSERDPLALSDAEAEIAKAKASEIGLWIKDAVEKVVKYADELAHERVAMASNDSQSL